MPRYTVNNLLAEDTRKISTKASPFNLEKMKRLLETVREATLGRPVGEHYYEGWPQGEMQDEYGGVPSIREPRWYDPGNLEQQGMFMLGGGPESKGTSDELWARMGKLREFIDTYKRRGLTSGPDQLAIDRWEAEIVKIKEALHKNFESAFKGVSRHVKPRKVYYPEEPRPDEGWKVGEKSIIQDENTGKETFIEFTGKKWKRISKKEYYGAGMREGPVPIRRGMDVKDVFREIGRYDNPRYAQYPQVLERLEKSAKKVTKTIWDVTDSASASTVYFGEKSKWSIVEVSVGIGKDQKYWLVPKNPANGELITDAATLNKASALKWLKDKENIQ